MNDSYIGRYILDGRLPVPCEDLLEWGEWVEKDEHLRVAYDRVAPGISVSTIFLGLDHNFSGLGDPILFESMIFAPGIEGLDQSMRRYATWEEAEEGHREMLFELEMALSLRMEK